MPIETITRYRDSAGAEHDTRELAEEADRDIERATEIDQFLSGAKYHRGKRSGEGLSEDAKRERKRIILDFLRWRVAKADALEKMTHAAPNPTSAA